LAYTLQVGREAMEERLALQVSSFAELSEKLHRYLQDPQGDGDCYRGQVRRQDAYGAFMTDEDGQQAVATWMSKGKYRKLLELWVKGATIDWKFLYREDLPRRISLPTYPFAPERYWISTAQGRYKEPHRQAAPDEASGDGMTSRAEGRDQGPAKRVALRSLADPSVEHVGTGASPVPTRSSTLSPSQSQLEKELVRSLAQTLYIEESAIAVEKPFMEMGLDSVIGAAWIQSLNKQYASKLKASSVYNYPTIRQMAGFLEKGLLKQEQALVQSIPTLSLDDILQQLQQGTVDLGQADQLVHQVLTRAKGGDDR